MKPFIQQQEKWNMKLFCQNLWHIKPQRVNKQRVLCAFTNGFCDIIVSYFLCTKFIKEEKRDQVKYTSLPPKKNGLSFTDILDIRKYSTTTKGVTVL